MSITAVPSLPRSAATTWWALQFHPEKSQAVGLTCSAISCAGSPRRVHHHGRSGDQHRHRIEARRAGRAVRRDRSRDRSRRWFRLAEAAPPQHPRSVLEGRHPGARPRAVHRQARRHRRRFGAVGAPHPQQRSAGPFGAAHHILRRPLGARPWPGAAIDPGGRGGSAQARRQGAQPRCPRNAAGGDQPLPRVGLSRDRPASALRPGGRRTMWAASISGSRWKAAA